MKTPRSMSIIVVQLDEDEVPVAYVRYEDGPRPGNSVSLEVKLDQVQDATDMQMWAQMVAARVCDAL